MIERWQKSPTFSTKEPYILCKRAYILRKRALRNSSHSWATRTSFVAHDWDVAHLILCSKALHSLQKSPTFSTKEPYILPAVFLHDLDVTIRTSFQKSPTFSAKGTCILYKRALPMLSCKNNYSQMFEENSWRECRDCSSRKKAWVGLFCKKCRPLLLRK